MDPSVNPSAINSGSNRVLVCGLGSLGQHCVATLKAFGVAVSAIDLSEPELWEIPELPGILEQLVIADCRQAGVLERVGVHRCRAVLLVTGNERMNLESAFAVRALNPRARLVVRSSKQNLNSLLSEQLGNFAAYEATEVTAPAFAVAALGGDMIGWFKIDDQPFRALKHAVTAGDVWCNRRGVEELNTSFRRVIAHVSPDGPTPTPELAVWDPDRPVKPGDIVYVLEASDWRMLAAGAAGAADRQESERGEPPSQLWRRLYERVRPFWKADSRRRAVMLSGVIVAVLLAAGTALVPVALPDHRPSDGFYMTIILLMGGFGDIFGSLQPDASVPWWLRLFSLLLTITGIALCGLL